MNTASLLSASFDGTTRAIRRNAEVIIHDGALSDADRVAVETYLRVKYELY